MEGSCETRFEPLAEAFQLNFRESGELGAAVAVYHEGRLAVDLWGGLADPDGQPWQRDTVACMMSVAKGIVGLCMAMLYDRGQLDLEAPVALYWPEFAEGGKGEVSVATALSHHAAIPAFDDSAPGDIYDWDAMVSGLAAQTPYWPPGTRLYYHSATLGFIAGEILRRIDGRSIGDFIRDEIAGPLGADYFFGLSPGEVERCATMIASAGNVVNAAKAPDAPEMLRLSWQSLPATEDFNSIHWRTSQIPSVNGHGTAGGIARIYGALAIGGALDGVKLLDTNSLEPFLIERGSGTSEGTGLDLRSGLCFMLSSPSRPMGGRRGFGHSGAGGAQGFADPETRTAMCYCPNRMHDGSDVGIRADRILKALDYCLR